MAWTAAQASRGDARRQVILAALAVAPGPSVRTLARTTQIPVGCLAHHLKVLLRQHRICRFRLGPSVRIFLFAPGESPLALTTAALRREHGLSAVLDYVAANPLTPQRVVIEAVRASTGMPRTTVQHCLARLCRHGLLASRPVGVRGTGYVAVAEAAARVSLGLPAVVA